MILDEATSALDAKPEVSITSVFTSLAKSVMSIFIAHRLSTVQHRDRVISMKSREILGQGSIEQVRELVPDFDNQANLIGL